MSTDTSSPIRRVGIIFSGGPAPGANAVISAAVTSFLDSGHEVVGFFHGYSNLQAYDRETHPLIADEHYRVFTERDMRGLRNQRGIVIGTARANPGKGITQWDQLKDPSKTQRLHKVYQALVDLECDALISIGGDDTLKTANFLYEYQKHLPENAKRVRVVHLPKTIDNDYRGIDFTFGFFTAVDVMAKELQNLKADAIATGSYFLAETMGRKAGWLSYGVAMAGEANLVIGVEDVRGALATEEKDGEGRLQTFLNVDALVDRIVSLIQTRAKRGKHYGTVVIAEGLAEMMPPSFLGDVQRDDHGHISLGKVNLARIISDRIAKYYEDHHGTPKKVTPIQLGYESRCAPPHAYDVALGSQLGCGAYRALVEEQLDGHMVSVEGQLQLCYVPFAELIDQETLLTAVRFIDPKSDFWRLARFLETQFAAQTSGWLQAPRTEAPKD